MKRTFAIVALTCSVVSAQEKVRNDEASLPIPIATPQPVTPGQISPLTPEQKVQRAIRNVVSPRALVGRLLNAGYDHITDDPSEWSGNLDGFAQRYASSLGRLAVRQGVQLSTDLIFHLEPRYDRCNCTGVKARMLHAWKRVVVARTDRGTEFPHITNFAGAYIPPMITLQWEPASQNTWSNKIENGSTFLAVRGATNMLREFWPEISRSIRKAKPGK